MAPPTDVPGEPAVGLRPGPPPTPPIPGDVPVVVADAHGLEWSEWWRRLRSWRGWRTAVAAIGVGIASVAIAAWALKLWRADLALPLRYGPIDDTKFYLALVKNVIDGGWWPHTTSLGAPYGSQLLDFPQGGDNLNLALIWLFGRFSANAALVTNLFYLATFALASMSCFAVFRALGTSRAAAAVGAVLFSLLAYHFFRGESHLLLSAYYAVPLSCYLFLRLLDGRGLFTRRAAGRRLSGWATATTLVTVGMCLVIGSDSLYYATFAVVMLVGGVLGALLARRGRVAVSGLMAILLITLTVGVNLSPSLVYQLRHGANSQIVRSPAQDEAHGLKLTNLVLPAPNGRIGLFNRASAKYDNAVSPGYCEACYASLGTVGTVGFAWLALIALAALVGAAGALGARPLARRASAGVLIAFAVAALGGVSSLLEFFVTPDIRGWNRMSVFIAFFALLAVVHLLDLLATRLRRRRRGMALWSAALVAVLAFGIYDQTSDYFVPDYGTDAFEYHSDDAFVKAIQSTMPAGASIFQLPYVPYPEGYPTTVDQQLVTSYATSYEQLRGYLHSTTLRWSYGATKGRSSDWAAQLAAKPVQLVVPAAAAAGFDGLWLEPDGYSATRTTELLAVLEGMLGEQPLVSEAGDLWFFDLRAYAQRLRATHTAAAVAALRTATLTPLRTACRHNGVTLINPTNTTRVAIFSTVLQASASGRGSVVITYPNGHSAPIVLSGGRVLIRRKVTVPPGTRIVLISADGSPHSVQARQATLDDEAFIPWEAGPLVAGAPPSGLLAPPCVYSP